MCIHANDCREKEDVVYSPLETRDLLHHTGPHREVSGLIGRQKEQEESMDKSLYCGVDGRKWERQGKQV